MPAIAGQDLQGLTRFGAEQAQRQILRANRHQTQAGKALAGVDVDFAGDDLGHLGQGQITTQLGRSLEFRGAVLNPRLRCTAVEWVVNDSKLTRCSHSVGILHQQLHASRLACFFGGKPKQVTAKQALRIHAIPVDQVDFFHQCAGQGVQSVSCRVEHLVAKAHDPTNFAAANAGHGLGSAIGVDHELELARVDLGAVDGDGA